MKYTFILLVCSLAVAGCRKRQRPVTTQDRAVLPEWSAYWRRQHPGVKASRARVHLTVAKQARVLADGHISLALIVGNRSKLALETSLPHEWHGGEWPLTNLYLSVTPVGSQRLRAFHPAYLLNERLEATAPTRIQRGDAKTVDVRMDWSGTGSVHGVPLMERGEAKTYRVYALLVFTADGKKQHVVGPETTVSIKNGRTVPPKASWGKALNGLRAGLPTLPKGRVFPSAICFHNTTAKPLRLDGSVRWAPSWRFRYSAASGRAFMAHPILKPKPPPQFAQLTIPAGERKALQLSYEDAGGWRFQDVGKPKQKWDEMLKALPPGKYTVTATLTSYAVRTGEIVVQVGSEKKP